MKNKKIKVEEDCHIPLDIWTCVFEYLEHGIDAIELMSHTKYMFDNILKSDCPFLRRILFGVNLRAKVNFEEVRLFKCPFRFVITQLHPNDWGERAWIKKMFPNIIDPMVGWDEEKIIITGYQFKNIGVILEHDETKGFMAWKHPPLMCYRCGFASCSYDAFESPEIGPLNKFSIQCKKCTGENYCKGGHYTTDKSTRIFGHCKECKTGVPYGKGKLHYK